MNSILSLRPENALKEMKRRQLLLCHVHYPEHRKRLWQVEVICRTTKNEYLLGDLIFFCRIERKNAQFGMVRVYWQVLQLLPDASITEVLPGQEFTKVSDYVTFADGSSSEVLRLTPREDGIAEQDESFEIRLVNATGKIAT